MATKWTSFDNGALVKPTTKEILASLSAAQKTGFLNAYTEGWADNYPKVKSVLKIRPTAVARHLKNKLDEIQRLSRKYMRGEVLVTPEEKDPKTGEVTTPAVYNTPPGTSTALVKAIEGSFVDEFTSTQVKAILTTMVKYSKADGSGTFTYYKNAVKQ